MMLMRRTRKLSIAIPVSIISETPHLREKTYKIGIIARAASIFRIEEILIYMDKYSTQDDLKLVKTILEYMNTPQYLRKILYPKMELLKYVGILPPLRTPHHPKQQSIKELELGSYRIGLVLSTKGGQSLVELGFKYPIPVPYALRRGSLLTFKLESKKPLLFKPVNNREVPHYWGYRISIYSSLKELLKNIGEGLIIATSRHGKSIKKLWNKLRDKWMKSKEISIIFGSPYQGLFQIAKEENLDLKEYVHFIANMIPNQGIETVRTEEAIFATLSILNLING